MIINYKITSLFIAISLICSLHLFGDNQWTLLNQKGKQNTEINLVSSSNDETVVSFNINSYQLKKVNTGNAYAVTVEIPDGARIQEKGAPDLPRLSKSIIVPDNKKMTIELVSWDYIDIADIVVAPSKGILTRDVDPATIPFTYGSDYNSDSYFPFIQAQIEFPYIMRDYRGQVITVFPVRYNPVTKVLRIYKNITVKVKPSIDSNADIINEKSSVLKSNAEFNSIYQNHFLNYNLVSSAKYNALPEIGKMLIICHDAFAAAMQPFIIWKKQKGMQVEMVNVSTIGNNATAIKAFVSNYFNTNGLTFLLLVGDHAQVNTAIATGGDSDHEYGYLLGNDHYADIIVGRFSAESLIDVNMQVEKSVKYEKDLKTTDTWLNTGVGIGSDQGGGGSGDLGESDHIHMDFIRDTLMHYGYSSVDQIYDPGATAAMLANSLNAGRGIINYVGHGSDFEFVTTGFNVADVNALTNIDKQPYIFSVACVNGNFKSQTCFAEAWLRANQAGKPTGAVATLMSTINQSWDSPMCGQDEMDRLVTHNISYNTKRSFGGIALAGIGKMIDNYQGDGENMADTWTIFGDPSLIIRTKTPQTMTVSHQPVTFIGTTQFTVNCNVDSALICLSLNGEILGTGYSNGSFATIAVIGLNIPDTMIVTVTAQDYVTYQGDVAIIPNAGAYVICQSQAINDAAGNNNSVAEYGESINLNITLKNVGVVFANNVNAILSTTDSYIAITQNTHNFGNIAADASVLNNDAYSFSVSGNVPDGHSALFTLQMTDINDSIWIAQFPINIHAPALNIQFVTVDDASGNQNHYLDPSESANLNINVLNTSISGSAVSSCTVTCTNSHVTINTNNVSTGILNGNSTTPASFNVSVDATATPGSYAEFEFTLTAGAYSKTLALTLPIGLIIEDWECNGFTHFPWASGGERPWVITSAVKYQGMYAAKSGAIPNATSSQDSTSELSLTLNTLTNDSISFYKKVSSESGYDFLRFFINDIMQGEWSGEADWSLQKYAVGIGSNSFKWVYSKDYYMTGGSDCAWIDNITLPPHSVSTQIKNINSNNTQLFSVYPNPVSKSNSISCKWQLPDNLLTGEIEIYNMFGQKLNSVKVMGNSDVTNIDIKNMANGIYHIVLKANNKIISGSKLIVE